MQFRADIRAPRSILILGAGAVVSECYIPALMRLGWQDRVVVTDTSAQAIDVVSRRCPGLRARIGSYADVLRDREFLSGIDCSVIALPNSLHEEALVLALSAGLDVLCEKPLASNVDTCLRLAATAEQCGRRLAVAMVRRFIPYVVVIHDAIKNGLLGHIEEVTIEHGNAFHWPSESGSYFRKENGGLFLNMGIHYLDQIESWLGPLTPTEYRDDEKGGVEANCKILLHSATGTRASLRLSYTHELANLIHVRGTRGEITAKVDEFGGVKWQSYESGISGQLQPSRPFSIDNLPLDFISAFAEQFIRFADTVARRTEPSVSATQAAATQRIIEWGYSHRKSLHAPVVRTACCARPSLTPKRTIVTGGTGFLGVSLLERLCEMGFTDIAVPVRSYQSGANAARFPVDRVLTNLLDPESVRKLLAGAQYVFHLAYGTSGIDAGRVTMQGTKHVVDAAIDAGVETVVVVSTATVFGHPRTEVPVNENFPYRRALGEYGRTKTAAEKYALRRAKTAGQTRIVVINPAGIYGPNGRLFVEFPVRAALAGNFAWIDGGVGKFNYTFVENVVDALVLAARNVEAHGQNFIISDGVCTFREYMSRLLGSMADSLPSYSRLELVEYERSQRPTWRELTRAMMNDEVMRAVNGIPFLKVPKKLFEKRFPKSYARIQVGRKSSHFGGGVAARAAPSRPPPSPWLADIFGPIDIEYSSEKAKTLLGWTPVVALDSGLAASVTWLQETGIHGDFRQVAAMPTDPAF